MPMRIVGDPSAAWASTPTDAAASAASRTPRNRTLDLDRLPAELFEPAPQAFLEVDLRLPAEDLPRARDVRTALLRIVDRESLEDDLARRAGDADDGLGELEHRHLVIRVAEVH